jgi:hypothetical protein
VRFAWGEHEKVYVDGHRCCVCSVVSTLVAAMSKKKKVDKSRKVPKTPKAPAKGRPLTDEELASTAGGRDAASGLPTGQRMHKPY